MPVPFVRTTSAVLPEEGSRVQHTRSKHLEENRKILKPKVCSNSKCMNLEITPFCYDIFLISS